jgi:hypothetical protein
MYVIAACASTSPAEGGASTVSQKETWLTQAGFKPKTVTTPTQQQLVSKLAVNRVSPVKYQGKTYYVYPTAAKDHILVGRQAQYNAYKKASQAQKAQVQAKPANQRTAQEQQMLDGDPEWSGETVGPRHLQVETFDGFGPLDPMQGD